MCLRSTDKNVQIVLAEICTFTSLRVLFLVGDLCPLFYVSCALHTIRVFDLEEIVLALGTDHWILDGEGRGLDKYQKKKLSIDFKRERKALQMNCGENKIVQSFLRPSQKVFTLRLVTKKITK